MSKASETILAKHRAHTRLAWSEVQALLTQKLFGDVVQEDYAEDQALFRGPLHEIHVGSEKVIFDLTFVARRVFPTSGFVYAREKQKFFVSAGSQPWVDSTGAIHCPVRDRESTLILPRSDDYGWKRGDVESLPSTLWLRGLLRHMDVLASSEEKIIALHTARSA